MVNEVTSPQAFEATDLEKRVVWRPAANFAAADHNVPTTDRAQGIADDMSRIQVSKLQENAEKNGIVHFGMGDPRQGILHVVAPELGLTLPGMTIVCGDSHTSTHGAFGTLAFGIGTSEIEHVLATQTLVVDRSKTMRVNLTGELPFGCCSKDVALALVGLLGASGGVGYAIEYTGPVVDRFSMEARMTLCNMSVEIGAKVGLIAVDEITLEYCRIRSHGPRSEQWDAAVSGWTCLRSDSAAAFDLELEFCVSGLAPQVTWGTSPDMVIAIAENVPDPANLGSRRPASEAALRYMGLDPGTKITNIQIDKVFIGSCTNGRIEDLRVAAGVLRSLNKKVASNVRLALAVPGSSMVKHQAEEEGLHEVFKNAGFEWREAGCSMCLGMNPDHLEPGERVASTSNRNFEGRQGAGGRSHLVSPAMAAAAAVAGHFVDIRNLRDSAGNLLCNLS